MKEDKAGKKKPMGRGPEGSRYSTHRQAQPGLLSRQGTLHRVRPQLNWVPPRARSSLCQVHSDGDELPRSEHHQNDGHEQTAQHPEAKCNLWLFVSPILPCRGTRRQRATTNGYSEQAEWRDTSCADISDSYVMVLRTHTKSQASR